jgi:hypothetical protein
LATGPATDFTVGSKYSIEEVLQAELRRALTRGSFTQLSELKALAARPIFQPLRIYTNSVRKYLHSPSEIYINDINSFGQQISSIFKVGKLGTVIGPRLL